jgi:L-threonylcarbamoyladenylate synthase
MILSATEPGSIARCTDTLRAGGLIGLPTETVYGLAADACNDAAVARIFAAKGRPPDHPLIVHLAALEGGLSGVAHFAQNVPPFAKQLMAAFWPGPLTLILPRRAGVAAASAGGQNSIGLRCPAHEVAQAVLVALRRPSLSPVVWGLAAPSANRFGRVSPTTAQHVYSEFGAQFDILDGGACAVGIESTIIDCTRGAPMQLRPGRIGAADIQAACGMALAEPTVFGAPRASGTLISHYAPNARVRLWSADALLHALANRQQATDTSIALYANVPLPPLYSALLQHAMPDDPVQVAQELFAVLRALDAQGVQEIWVQQPPEAAAWDGVRDRLQRASHRA